MKRFSDSDVLIPAADPSTVSAALDSVLRGWRKTKPQGRRILENREFYERRISGSILSGSFAPRSVASKVVEGKKRRIIRYLTDLEEKATMDALMATVESLFKPRFIRATAASIKGRGLHYLVKMIRRDLSEDPEGTKFVFADDVSNFYGSVDRSVMMDVLRHYFKGPKTLAIFERFLDASPEGLSIGFRSSQFFGNLLLSHYIDHAVKSGAAVKHYYRYCDDKRVLTGSKEKAWEIGNLIRAGTEAAGLNVKKDLRVFPVSDGMDFVGYKIFPDHVRISKANKQRAARKLKKLKSRRRRREVIASFYSFCKHADANNLFYKITGVKMGDYKDLKSLSELGIPLSPGVRRNGKKNYPCPDVPLNALVGSQVCIEDFQTGISTKWTRKQHREAVANGETGAVEKTKYLVCARVITPNRAQAAACNVILKKGALVKFFTGYPDMCDVLDALKETGGLGINKVSIVKNQQGSYTDYTFGE